MRSGLQKFFLKPFTGFVSHCEDGESKSLLELANERKDGTIPKIRTPCQFENLRQEYFSKASINTYEGFRMFVQKQINLNAVASHFFWLGAQQPYYQYRFILPMDDGKTANVATDLDFNVEGEFKCGLTNSVQLKSSFLLNEQAPKSFTVDLDHSGPDYTAQLSMTRSTSQDFSVSYMQGIIPNLAVGGSASYSTKSREVNKAFGFAYEPEGYIVAGHWDKPDKTDNSVKLMVLRKVNPNRVHISTDFVKDEKGEMTMGVGAEYMLKQSKLHFGIDSNLTVKSYLETNFPAQGAQMQLSGEIGHMTGQSKFGFGVVFG